MSRPISRQEIIARLKARGFQLSSTKEHAEQWVSPDGESINLKTGDRFPLVAHPKHENHLSDLLAINGVLRGSHRYAHNSNFLGFPKRIHTGEKPIAYGLDFGFGSVSALDHFLDSIAAVRGGGYVPVPVFDSEAQSFLDGFMEPDNPQFVYWLPRYIRTLDTVADALEQRAPEAVFDLIWRTFDNSVSKAGPGVLDFALVDRLRDRFVAITWEIHENGDAAQFDELVSRMEGWREQGELPKVPHLLLARAFAAIHPGRYHTTVAIGKQNQVVPWFVQHTGFVVPEGNWAAKAAALTKHLDGCGVFANDRERRNIFPWYVFDQLRDGTGRVPFRPGHTSRQVSGVARQSQGHAIEYRQNVIQDRLVRRLIDQFGQDAVATEHSTGTGGRADALVRRKDGSLDLYEIKPAQTAREAVRQAVGQLLEYGYRRGGLQPQTLCVVSDAELDELTREYLATLEARFSLNLGYLRVASGGEEDDRDE